MVEDGRQSYEYADAAGTTYAPDSLKSAALAADSKSNCSIARSTRKFPPQKKSRNRVDVERKDYICRPTDASIV